MKFEEIIQRGKHKLKSAGIVESISFSPNEEDLLPQLPGIGWAGNGETYKYNRLMLEKYCIKTQMIGNHFTPDTSTSIFGQKIMTPILAAPMSGIKTNLAEQVDETEFLSSILAGSAVAGSIGACGDSYDTTNDYLAAKIIKDTPGIAVLKPRSLKEIKRRIDMLIETDNITAIGIDLDGLTGLMLEEEKVSKKNSEELRTIRSYFNGPMFLKGILSVEDALMAHDLGFDGIVISNHGGRSIDRIPATIQALPDIVKTLKNKLTILVDGGIRDGFDAFIYLALGADAVLVGRTVLYGAVGGGRNGVTTVINKLTSDLSRAMLLAGCENIKSVKPNTIQSRLVR